MDGISFHRVQGLMRPARMTGFVLRYDVEVRIGLLRSADSAYDAARTAPAHPIRRRVRRDSGESPPRRP